MLFFLKAKNGRNGFPSPLPGTRRVPAGRPAREAPPPDSIVVHVAPGAASSSSLLPELFFLMGDTSDECYPGVSVRVKQQQQQQQEEEHQVQ